MFEIKKDQNKADVIKEIRSYLLIAAGSTCSVAAISSGGSKGFIIKGIMLLFIFFCLFASYKKAAHLTQISK